MLKIIKAIIDKILIILGLKEKEIVATVETKVETAVAEVKKEI